MTAAVDVLEHVIQDDGYDRLYVPVRIAAERRDALRRVVEYGRALEGGTWRYDVIPRPWANTDVVVIHMRPAPEMEPGMWVACEPDEPAAEPFWQVWT